MDRVPAAAMVAPMAALAALRAEILQILQVAALREVLEAVGQVIALRAASMAVMAALVDTAHQHTVRALCLSDPALRCMLAAVVPVVPAVFTVATAAPAAPAAMAPSPSHGPFPPPPPAPSPLHRQRSLVAHHPRCRGHQAMRVRSPFQASGMSALLVLRLSLLRLRPPTRALSLARAVVETVP